MKKRILALHGVPALIERLLREITTRRMEWQFSTQTSIILRQLGLEQRLSVWQESTYAGCDAPPDRGDAQVQGGLHVHEFKSARSGFRR